MSGAPKEMVERQGRMLAELSELGMALTRRTHERAMAAEDPDKAERLALAFHRLSRSVRQTLALEARLEREARRDAVEAERRGAETRREALKARRSYVGGVGSRLIWTEAERDEVSELLVDLKRWIDEEAFFEDAFLTAPVEALIERLREDLGLVEAELDDEEEEEEEEPFPLVEDGTRSHVPSAQPPPPLRGPPPPEGEERSPA